MKVGDRWAPKNYDFVITLAAALAQDEPHALKKKQLIRLIKKGGQACSPLHACALLLTPS